MTNADLLRRLRFALQIDDRSAARLFAIGGRPIDVQTVRAWRLPEEQESHGSCDVAALNAFLRALVLDRRGPPPAAKGAGKRKGPADQIPVADNDRDNNEVLKQLRIALSLRGEQVHDLLVLGGSQMSRSEANALLRSAGARNFRRCGDQVLRQFLAGLSKQRLQS